MPGRITLVDGIRMAGFAAPIALLFAIVFAVWFWRGFSAAGSPVRARHYTFLLVIGSAISYLGGSGFTAFSSWEIREMTFAMGTPDPTMWIGDQALLDIQRVLTACCASLGLLLAGILFWFRGRSDGGE